MQDTLIVFDIDGTLLNSVSRHQKAFLKALQAFSFKKVDSNWAAYKHHTDSWIFSEVFRANRQLDPGGRELQEFEGRLLEFFWDDAEEQNIAEIDGALRFLEILKQNGVAYAFATGGMLSVTLEKLKNLGSDATQVPLATATDHFEREVIVQLAAERAAAYTGRRFNRFISVGDGLWDAITAKNLGYEFIGIQSEPEKLQSYCNPSQIFPHFLEMDLRSIT